MFINDRSIKRSRCIMVKCRRCGKDVPFLSKHIGECLGKDPYVPTMHKTDSVLEQLFFHVPEKARHDVLVESEKDVVVVFTGDWHVGNQATDHAQLINDLNLLALYDVKIVLMGDLIDNYGASTHQGGKHEAVIQSDEQRFVVERMLRNMKEVVGVIQGCHEEWSYTTDHFTYGEYIADKLGAKFMGGGGKIMVIAGEKEYSVAASHKYRGGTMHPLVNGLKLAGAIGPVDVAVTAHHHDPAQGQCIMQGRPIHVLRPGSYKLEDRFMMNYSAIGRVPTMPVAVFTKKGGVMSFIDFKQALPYLESMSLISRRLVPLVDEKVQDEPDEKTQPSEQELLELPQEDKVDGEKGQAEYQPGENAMNSTPVLEGEETWPNQPAVNFTTMAVDVREDRSIEICPDDRVQEPERVLLTKEPEDGQ